MSSTRAGSLFQLTLAALLGTSAVPLRGPGTSVFVLYPGVLEGIEKGRECVLVVVAIMVPDGTSWA
jgi:hypothetical protein